MITGKQVLFQINYKILCKKKGENGFSYRFNLKRFIKLQALINTSFYGVVSVKVF